MSVSFVLLQNIYLHKCVHAYKSAIYVCWLQFDLTFDLLLPTRILHILHDFSSHSICFPNVTRVRPKLAQHQIPHQIKIYHTITTTPQKPYNIHSMPYIYVHIYVYGSFIWLRASFGTDSLSIAEHVKVRD